MSVATTRGASNKRAPVLVAQGILVVLILVSYVMAAWAAINSGVTWDEKYHVAQLERAIKPVPYTNLYGEEIQVRQVDRLDFVYGLAYQYLGHAANIARGNEQWGSPQTTAESYAVRHLVGVGLSVAAGVAVFVSVRLITGSTTASLFGWAALALWPTWLGHSFMNPKDFPAAVGWTIFSTGLALVASGLIRPNRAPRIIGILVVALGTALGVGTRIAFWLPFLVIVVFFSFMMWYLISRLAANSVAQKTNLSQSSFHALDSILGFLIGVAFFFVFHPHLIAVFPQLFLTSISTSGNFELSVFVLTNGSVVDVQNAMTRFYLPLWFWAVIPIPLALLILIGLSYFIRGALRQVTKGEPEILKDNLLRSELFMTPFVIQVIFLPFLVVASNAPTWDAMRHHLYVLPGLAVLASVGVWWGWNQVEAIRPKLARSAGKTGIVLIGVLAIAEFVAFDVRLFPYNYVYVGPHATIGRAPDLTWETDYWGLSVREAVTSVPPTGRLSTWGVSSSWEPFIHLRSGEVARDLQPNEFYWIKTQRNDFGVQQPGDCKQIDQIGRTVLGKTFTMSRTYICQNTNS